MLTFVYPLGSLLTKIKFTGIKIMRVVGKRKERNLTFHADGALLREGALFNTEIQKMQSTFRFPKGVYCYKSHEEADQHMMNCVVKSMVALQQSRHG